MKLNLPDVTNVSQLATINSNFDAIADELQNKVLYRDNPDGEDNTVKKDIDVNGRGLYNAGTVSTQELYINGKRVIPVGGLVESGSVDPAAVLYKANNLSDVQSAATSRVNLGLGDVDNTSDVNKPVSSPVASALNLKQNTLISGVNIKTLNGNSILGSGDVIIGGSSSDRIVILGDSLSYAGAERLTNWPALLQQSLHSMGSNTSVVNLAVSGHSFYRVNSTISFGSNTALQQAIAVAPSLIIIVLGANDALIKVDGRSLAQVKSDASTTLSTLRTALPSTKIVYVSELCYDSTNFSASSIKNKGVVPAFFSLTASGILSGLYCAEALEINLDAGQQAAFVNWDSFDSYLKVLGFDGTCTLDYFKIARLGATMPDGLHPQTEGNMLMHSFILAGISSISAVTTLYPFLLSYVSNITQGPALIFGLFLTASGTGYISNVSQSNSAAEKAALENVRVRSIDPDAWFMPYKTSLGVAPTSGSLSGKTPILFTLRDAPPKAQIYASIDGGAWGGIGAYTDSKGSFSAPNIYSEFGVGVGTHTIRYKAGNTASAAVSLSVSS